MINLTTLWTCINANTQQLFNTSNNSNKENSNREKDTQCIPALVPHLMTDEEVYAKYSRIPREQIVIYNSPAVPYNPDRMIIISHKNTMYSKIYVNGEVSLKRSVVIKPVVTSTSYPVNIKPGYKLIVYPQNTEHYRYTILKISEEFLSINDIVKK